MPGFVHASFPPAGPLEPIVRTTPRPSRIIRPPVETAVAADVPSRALSLREEHDV
ncbi:hypothetical protein [Actinoplanes sp. G11-F43]|uniref:hypothetical protein n=1 Tax=Actinoplanes sp. G11-F43 TaxID=3424130 RepID=UPI003D35934B